MTLAIRSSNGMAGLLRALGPCFETASGYPLAVRYATSATLAREIAAGAAFDVALLTQAAIADLVAQGRIRAGSNAVIARSVVGIAVLAGTPKPDIATPASLKQALLAASSVAYTTEGASGIHFTAVLERLGIAAEVAAKARLQPGGLVAERVVRGEAALAVQQMSELVAVAGVDIVGPLPPQLQHETVFAMGIAAATPALDAARQFCDLLAARETAPLIAAAGLLPN
jgi:molybdate transport system substrate-binding protein